MAFRSKTPDRVVTDLMTLARKHKWLNFNAVDNIIAMPYFRELLPKLRDSGYDLKLFYETKSNLKKEQLRAMRDAGVLQIQPGIESLSTPILKLMKKGVTALQNIRFLKWCAEFGIETGWNVLYGFPGEPLEEFDRMAIAMKSLTHLQPPRSLAALDLQRFTPCHQRPREGDEQHGQQQQIQEHEEVCQSPKSSNIEEELNREGDGKGQRWRPSPWRLGRAAKHKGLTGYESR